MYANFNKQVEELHYKVGKWSASFSWNEGKQEEENKILILYCW